MKKILMLTIMFVSTNAWSADYQICIGSIDDVERCVEKYLRT